jgi:N-acetylglucosaminyl-diphospho-decaprenol L-rhamnosyltransferase
MLDWDHTSERDVAAVTGACLFVRRTAFEQVGLFDERFFVYGEEIDWLVRAGKLGLITRFLPSVTVRHTAGNSTPAASAALERLLIESHYRYTAKHFGPTQELTLRATLFVADCVRLMHRPRWLGEFRKRALVHLGLRYERPR